MADERSALAERTAETGWTRHQDDRVDVYMRGTARVRVIWQGDDAISGSSRFQDDIMESYTRELNTVRAWLAG
ncbi:hypothetical protein FZI85_04875 [Mycobacterium sp. CBMA293]|uniref:hypothetical protein n=1 Tax=unclassified Mycolicibacterium TaxID=2636767 RepID=UPI0012DEBF80|nr:MULTISPECIES: hypothetical protein [unclassified Mycolicibacterium]MUL48939.1 hypothetical protein [Mycolicibacterium sp. CBMA 360]MUL58647.1 hypothetical protein [Mycolicibacterium sp. CBMA 335]MUL74105.1 hypothetical protein [Mycolicibacterium sp. CBMA 311]MUL93530.1 hypothetical protein [Mycolicibacterium sp. CBMA 230]MUM04748.1 hypothetical protein [Mycolicibacterium sp. CBMA 213]